MRRFGLLVMLFAAGCATQTAAGPDYRVTWSDGHSDSPGVPAPVVCTATVAHPCAQMLYAATFTIEPDGSTFAWHDASGAANANGEPVAELMPTTDPQDFDGSGAIVLPMHGDESGLRHEAHIAPIADGYEGDVTWTLDTVAGSTTFHVVLAH